MMEGPIADVDGDEMFQSIGMSMVAKNKPAKKNHTSPPKGGQGIVFSLRGFPILSLCTRCILPLNVISKLPLYYPTIMECQPSTSTIHPAGIASSSSQSTGTGAGNSMAASTSIEEDEGGDMMQSNWGADVFEMVIALLPSSAITYDALILLIYDLLRPY